LFSFANDSFTPCCARQNRIDLQPPRPHLPLRVKS
jgi:hypothetical protein